MREREQKDVLGENGEMRKVFQMINLIARFSIVL